MFNEILKAKKVVTFIFIVFTIAFGAEKEVIENITPSFSQTESQLDSGFNLLGWLPFGPSYALAIKDSFCFVGSGGRIEVLLLNDSGYLAKVGEVKTKGVITDLDIYGNTLYAGLGNKGIEIFDISDPFLPNLLSFYPIRTYLWVFNIEISYPLLFSANDGNLIILDVTNARVPIELASINIGTVGVAVMDTFLFTGNSNSIGIYSISNPNSPQFLGWISFHGSPSNHPTALSVKYPYLLVGGFDNNPYNRYYCVIDVSELSNPTLVADTSFPVGIVWDAVIIDSLIYYLNWSSLTAFDIRNPTNPQLVFDSSNFRGYRFAIKDSFLIISSGYEIRVIDITDQTSPRYISRYNIETPPQDFCATEDFAYLERGNELISIDIRDPSTPIKVSSLMFPDEITDLIVKDSLLYLTSSDSALRIIDVSEPNNMIEIGNWIGSYPLRNLWIRDSLAFITDGDFLILDISDPVNPFFISSLPTPGNATSLFVQENYAYVNDLGYGIVIINISNPSYPFIEGVFERLQFMPSSLCYFEGHLYVTDNCLLIFDVSNPSSPILSDSIKDQNNLEFVDVKIKEGILFIVRKTNMFTNYYPFTDGINAYSIEQPSSPGLIAIYYSPGKSEKIMVNDKIHLLDSKFGYSILELIPVGIKESKNPNISDFFIKPRIGKANQILLEYSLPANGKPNIKLYDRTGRKVATLLNTNIEKGRHLLSIDNLSLPAAIYFVILEFEGRKISSKLLLLN